ncbi:hypothetical protein M3Y99_00192400 [Aphelenchoides fujianensis]|nr:hypothetical protein M3Y99_00192400 [Aphelenchoides fujianensis]
MNVSRPPFPKLKMRSSDVDVDGIAIGESPTADSHALYSRSLMIQGLVKGLHTTRHGTAPTLPCTSSEDSDSSLLQRQGSAHSLPVRGSQPATSLYEKTLSSLAHDVHFQKEVALGKRIGFYRLGKELGCGNFSKVRLGVHVLTRGKRRTTLRDQRAGVAEKVAVKIMEKSKMDQKAQRLLAREIQSMEQTHHPNIIRLFECVETLSKTYLIMEYAGGGELYTYVHENGKLKEDIARSLFAQVVSAVAHLHSKNLVHRDIKAENVIFASVGWVKLADFGFSCQCSSADQLHTFCGSPPYASPELFRDESYVGHAVDVWALGILLYFMLVGVTPFRGETVQELKKSILEGAFTIPDYVSQQANTMITRMLDMEPAKRPRTEDLKKMFFFNDTKFTDSYVQFNMTPDEKELETCEMERKIWATLNDFGINVEMIKEAVGKGCRNSVIGAYRIVLYQFQAGDLEKERMKVNGHLIDLAERNRLIQQKLNSKSKTCALM